MAPAPELQDLIRTVEHDAPDEQPLTRLRTAAAMVDSVTDTADAALGYFVDQARRAGHSWADIGAALGVSKQAAQQRQARFGDGLRSPSFERFTPRARHVLGASRDTARQLGHGFVGTEHLLLAQFAEPAGIGAVVLTELGLTAERLREAIVAKVGPAGQVDADELPFTPRATGALRNALTVALELGHNYIGTEHLLLGVARTDGLAAHVLSAAGVTEEALRARVADKLAAYVAAKAAPVPSTEAGPAATPSTKVSAKAKKAATKRAPRKR